MSTFLFFFIDSMGSYFVYTMFVLAVMDEKIYWKRLALFMIFAGIPSGIVTYLLNAVLIKNYYIAYILSSLFVFAISVITAAQIWKRDYWKSLSAVGIAGIMQVGLGTVSTLVMTAYYPPENMSLIGYLGSIYVLYLPSSIVISCLLRRMHFSRAVRYLLEDEKNKRRITVRIMAMEIVVEVVFQLGAGSVGNETVVTYNAMVIMLMFLMIGIVVYLSKKEENANQLHLQQSMILQQQMYVEHLEQMQREMRVFRHDYKNMLSGMYLYAKEGEVEKIQDVLEKLEIDFDQKIGEQIHTAAQIGNIRIPEIKSLVLAKLSKMKKEGIDCSFEALYPFASIQMDVWDFARCLGILIDNAMEAASQQAHPNVELLLMCHGGFLTVRVANPWEAEPDMAHMWEEGYSTKGHGRGLGLSSYQRILAQYPDVVPMTSYENSTFVQEFTVAV